LHTPTRPSGGTAEHKVPAILARSLREAGWLTVRPNFRGVGGSEGLHDHGVGETDDLLAVSLRLQSMYPGLPLVLVGFSFGAYVQIGVARRLREQGPPSARLVLVGPGIGQVEGGATTRQAKCRPIRSSFTAKTTNACRWLTCCAALGGAANATRRRDPRRRSLLHAPLARACQCRKGKPPRPLVRAHFTAVTGPFGSAQSQLLPDGTAIRCVQRGPYRTFV